MQPILITAGVCFSCLLVALVSQLMLSPSSLETQSLGEDQPMATTTLQASGPGSANAPLGSRWELDPDNPNPKLFAMATDETNSGGVAPAQGTDEKQTPEAPQDLTMTITPSGLTITEVQVGTGREALANKNVTVHYDGRLENGTPFDSSRRRGQPFSFRLGAKQVIQGWDEGLVGMKEGGKRQLVIPPELGYGKRGAGGVIPPNATLVFDVELLKVEDPSD